MDYFLLKKAHIAFALISISGFMIRWIWMMNDSRFSRLRLTRIAPHVIDTLFLASGIVLAFSIGQYPVQQDWLSAKVIGLVAYIVCGVAAMSRRNSRTLRTFWFFAAVSVFSWIVSVAILKSARGYLSIF